MATSQNTPILIGGTLSTSIKSAHVRKLMQLSSATGYSLSEALNRALDLWMDVEAPIYLDYAKQEQQA